jgi:hypothetical protein
MFLDLTNDRKEARTANTGLRLAGRCANLELCASIQVQCWLTVLCSETRPNAKPENVNPIDNISSFIQNTAPLPLPKHA